MGTEKGVVQTPRSDGWEACIARFLLWVRVRVTRMLMARPFVSTARFLLMARLFAWGLFVDAPTLFFWKVEYFRNFKRVLLCSVTFISL